MIERRCHICKDAEFIRKSDGMPATHDDIVKTLRPCECLLADVARLKELAWNGHGELVLRGGSYDDDKFTCAHIPVPDFVTPELWAAMERDHRIMKMVRASAVKGAGPEE